MGLIPDDIIAQVLDRSDIVEIVSSYIPLKRAGRNFKALCPFHNEKSPSFMVAPDKQIYHCFGCGEGGNVIGFVMRQERMEFPEAVRFLAQKAGVMIPEATAEKSESLKERQQVTQINALAVQYYHQILLTNKSDSVETVRDYLKKRGVRLDVVRQFQLGYALPDWDGLLLFLKNKGISLKMMERCGLIVPRDSGGGYYDRFRDRIMFPIFDVKSQCVGFGARTLKEGVAKYINSPETEVYTKGQHLFGLHLTRQAIGKKDAAIVVEGYMDMIMPYQAGVDNIVAALGTALTVEQIRLLRRYTHHFVMLFDTDPAGQAAMVRSLDNLIEEDVQVRVATLTKGDDPDSFIRAQGLAAFHERIQNAVTLFDYKLKWLMDQHDPASIEGRTTICREMLATIAKLKSAVMRDGYLKQLAYRLGISESVLREEAKSVIPIGTKPVPASKTPVVVQRTVKPAEEQLLSLLLTEPELIGASKQQLQLTDFIDVEVRRFIQKIWDLESQTEKITLGNLFAHFPDARDQKLLANILVHAEAIQDKDKSFRDYITFIKKARLKAARETLSREIRAAELSGDRTRVDQLKEQFNQLIKA